MSDATYVMWMGAGESNGTFGMSAVATSSYPDGPFSLRRMLYPDGNETHDQTVFKGENRSTNLILVVFSQKNNTKRRWRLLTYIAKPNPTLHRWAALVRRGGSTSLPSYVMHVLIQRCAFFTK